MTYNIDNQVDEQRQKCESGRSNTNFTDLVGQTSELFLERGVIFLFLEFWSVDTLSAVFTDGKDNHVSCAFHDFWARDKERIVIDTNFEIFFVDLVSLTGDRTFICGHFVSIENDTVNWDNFTSFDLDNVAD